MATEELRTVIGVDGATQATQALRTMGGAVRSLQGDVAGAHQAMAKFGGSAGRLVLYGGVFAATATAMTRFMKGTIATAAQAERVLVSFNTVLANTNGLAADARRELELMTDRLSASAGKSSYRTQEIQTAVAHLASFRKGAGGYLTQSEIEVLLPAIIDYAEGMRKASGQQVELASVADMVGKAVAGQTQALRRAGVIADGYKIRAKGMSVIAEELSKKFGGQAAVGVGTLERSLTEASAAWNDFKISMGYAIAGPVKSLSRMLTSIARYFTLVNDKTRGVVSWVIALGAATVSIGYAIGMVRHAVMQLSAAYQLLARSAGSAATAQAASTAAAGGSAAAATTAAASIPFMARLGKGIGAGLAIGLAGQFLSHSLGGGETVAGTLVSTAATGAGIGATVGSLVPAIGTLIGGIVGGLLGLGYGATKIPGVREGQRTRDEFEMSIERQAAARGERGNQLLQSIDEELRGQTRLMVGGGKRAAEAWKEEDLQRLMSRILHAGAI